MKKLSQINEHLWSGIIKRSETGELRKEDGVVVGETGEGKKLVLLNEFLADGELVDINGKELSYIQEIETYFCIVKTEEDGYIYYKWNNDSKDNYLVKWFVVDTYEWNKKLIDAHFAPFRAMIYTSLSLDASDFNDMYYSYVIFCNAFGFRLNTKIQYYVFDNKDDAKSQAKTWLKNTIEKVWDKDDFIEWFDKLNNIDKFVNINLIIHELIDKECDRSEIKLNDKEIVKYAIKNIGYQAFMLNNDYLNLNDFIKELMDNFEFPDLFVKSFRTGANITEIRGKKYYVFHNR
jgi:hypothetical protein